MSLGSKMKSLRRLRGFTQATLADGIVTHGMLSRIEHDDAMPSLETLLALAERLEVSPGFLLDPADDLLPAVRTQAERQIADAFAAADYTGCLAAFAAADITPDKKNAAVYTLCAFRVGMQAFDRGDLPTARKWLDAAEAALPLAPIPPEEVTVARIGFVRRLAERIDAPQDILSLAPDKPDFGFQPSLFVFTLRRLADGDLTTVHAILTLGLLEAPYATYVKAKLKLADYKFIDAILALRPIAASKETSCFLALLAAAAVEDCCKTCEDYKGAYESRERREAILASVVR